jgi:hypothetical protein
MCQSLFCTPLAGLTRRVNRLTLPVLNWPASALCVMALAVSALARVAAPDFYYVVGIGGAAVLVVYPLEWLRNLRARPSPNPHRKKLDGLNCISKLALPKQTPEFTHASHSRCSNRCPALAITDSSARRAKSEVAVRPV